MESLTCDLFEPGMTPLHRAGLGGLVATLRKIEKNEHPPLLWNIDDRSVTFAWEKEQERERFFQFLFKYAFQLKDGILHLPGQYGDVEPPLEVKAALHEGLRTSMYGYSRSKKSSGPAIQERYEIDEKSVDYSYSPLRWYKHQKEGYEQFEKSLAGKFMLTGSFLPGAVQRHYRHKESQLMLSAQLALPLLFAPVGVIALRGRSKPGAVMLIPDIRDLSTVQYLLPSLLPRRAEDCQIENTADAALQAQVRVRGRRLLVDRQIPTVRGIWFAQTAWNKQQRPPAFVTEVRGDSDDEVLERFETVLACFRPAVRRRGNDDGSGFWTRSHVRPLAAENLLAGQPWYAGFSRLMTARDDSIKNPRPIRDSLKFERGGLQTMTQEISWDLQGEGIIVRSVHEAVRCRYGRIAAENKQNPTGMRNRMNREYERQRLAFAGAKTADALRHALADLWSRAGSNRELQKAWPHVLPLLSNEKWRLAQDLALLALASYQGQGHENIDLTDVEDGEQEAQ